MKINKSGRKEHDKKTYIGKKFHCTCGCQFEIESEFDVRQEFSRTQSSNRWKLPIEKVDRLYVSCPECHKEQTLWTGDPVAIIMDIYKRDTPMLLAERN